MVSNLLAEQVGAYVPAGWQGGLLLFGLALVLGGLALFWQRWQEANSP